MKNCKNCGKPLPDEAAFCPYCESDQTERRQMKPPAKKAWLPWAVCVGMAVILLSSWLVLRHKPRTIEAGPTAVWQDGKTTWNVFTTFDLASLETGLGQENVEVFLPPGESSHLFDLLFALRPGETGDKDAAAASADLFYGKIDNIEFAVEGQGRSETLTVSGPARNTSALPQAVALADIHYYPTAGSNTLIWKLHMKNGDTIILRHSMKADIQETVQISYEDAPLETAEELNEMLEEIGELYPSELVEITLPPVAYTEPIKVESRGCTLFGTEKNGERTVFRNSIEIITRNVQITELNSISFEGEGGTGVLAHEGVFINGCRFSGWENAVYGQEGSWPMISDSVFEENKAGFRFDSRHCTCSNPLYERNRFERNETAVLLENVPGGEGVLYFSECEFEENGTDVDNRSSFTVSYEW